VFPIRFDRRLPPAESETHSLRADSLLLAKAALINAVLFAAVLSCLTLGYETNDDVGMALTASGVLTGKPSHDLIGSNVLAGYLLQSLYGFTDRVNWYTLCLVAVHFVAMSGLLFLFLRTFRDRTSLILFVLLFAQFEVGLLLRLQSASLAVTAGVVGLLLVTAGLRAGNAKSHVAVTYGAVLIVLSGILRATSLSYAACLSLPFLVMEWLSRRQWRPIAQTVAIFVVALVPIAYDNLHYRADPAWNEFHKAHALLESLLDAPTVEYSEATRYFFDRIGWSRADWEMLESWFCPDLNLYSIPRLTRIVERFKGSNWGRARPADYVQNRFAPLIALQWMTFANLLLALLLSAGGRIKVLFLELCECLLLAVLFAYLSSFSKLPPHVLLPALFAVNIVSFFAILDAAVEQRFVIWRLPVGAAPRWIVGGAAMAFCAGYGWAFYHVAEHDLSVAQFNRHAQRGFRKIVGTVIDRYVAKDPSLVFVNCGETFPLVFCPPFDSTKQLRRIPLVWMYWGLQPPHCDGRLRELGFNPLCSGIYRKPNVRVTVPQPRIRPFARYVQEQYGEQIVAKSNDNFLVDDEDGGVARKLMLPVVQLVRASGLAQFSGNRPVDH
jgi:hypothetical protein